MISVPLTTQLRAQPREEYHKGETVAASSFARDESYIQLIDDNASRSFPCEK